MRNRFIRQDTGNPDRPMPPKGDSREQQAARLKFWIEYGNRKLAAAGKDHLHWCAKHGHYWIEERPGNPSLAPAAESPLTIAEIARLPRHIFEMGRRNGFFEPDALREAERLRKEGKIS